MLHEVDSGGHVQDDRTNNDHERGSGASTVFDNNGTDVQCWICADYCPPRREA